MISVDIEDLEREQRLIINFYKKQIEEFTLIKKECEKVEWSDKNYDEFVLSMNIVAQALSKLLQSITNGQNVYIVSELLNLANKYVENVKKFPKI